MSKAARKRTRTRPLEPPDFDRLRREARTLDHRPVLTFYRPRCPSCESADLHTIRSVRQWDRGVRRRWAKCRGCGERFTYELV